MLRGWQREFRHALGCARRRHQLFRRHAGGSGTAAIDKSEGVESDTEGCLSFPGMQGGVTRHKWIKVEAFNLKGKKFKKKSEMHKKLVKFLLAVTDRIEEEHEAIDQQRAELEAEELSLLLSYGAG